jgi:hypothetical protein
MTGRAREFVQQMLPMYVTEKALGKVGIYRETRAFAQIGDNRIVQETRFVRQHREMDVTSFGDAYQQTMVVSPGLDATVAGSQEEVDLFALLLIHQGILGQLESETRALNDAQKETRKEQGKVSERDNALLAMWRKLGKKRRANLRASDPKVAALCEMLEEEREHEARMNAEDWDY